MCDRCANIDYPIGDVIWLPCGGPASRYPGRRTRHTYSDSPADQQAWSKVAELVESLNRKQAEIERLKNTANPPADSRASFEGVE